MELDKLIAEAKKNKKSAQSELFRRYKDGLYLISLKYCRNTEDAEDNLHDAFVTIFQKIKTYKGKGSFEGWMKRITIYKAIDKYKTSNARNLPIIDDLVTDDTTVEELSSYTLETILKAIQELPDQYRQVFSLYELDDYSHKDIASLLDISEGTSKSNLHRAKHALKQNLLQAHKSTEISQNVL